MSSNSFFRAPQISRVFLNDKVVKYTQFGSWQLWSCLICRNMMRCCRKIELELVDINAWSYNGELFLPKRLLHVSTDTWNMWNSPTISGLAAEKQIHYSIHVAFVKSKKKYVTRTGHRCFDFGWPDVDLPGNWRFLQYWCLDQRNIECIQSGPNWRSRMSIESL